MTLQNIEANADKHMAVSSKKNIYFNSKYGSTATPVVWDSSSSVNLKANGILSMVGMDHIANRTTYTGGAISLEANNLISPSAGTLTFNAMDSSVLTNDPDLKNLEGDLTIQTNGALTLDPKIHKLGAAGDYELISKNGKLTLLGYGGANGHFSETVFRLTNNMGESPRRK